MKLTDRQKQAVESKSRGILVSASAGSGKTTAMVQRIIELIKNGANIGDMLIITFTKAAAADMRDKISSAVIDLCAADDKFAGQMRALPSAKIGTIDSWCSWLVKNYFYAVDADADYELIGEGEQNELFETAADSLIDEYVDKSAFFAEFYEDCLTNRRDGVFKRIVRDIIDYAETRVSPEEWLTTCCSEYKSGEAERYVMQAYKEREDAVFSALHEIALRATEMGYDKLAHCCSDAESAYYAGDDMPRMVLGRKAEYAEINADFAPIRKQLKDLIAYKKKIEGFTDMDETREKAKALAAFALDVYNVLQKEKKTRGLASYADYEHLALKVLRSESVGKEAASAYKYVFVDEYQDVNALQDALVAEVARDANLFIVGDVKQSIYAFRSSEPDIFLEKYNNPAAYGIDEVIHFNENFRSDRKIIDYCNRVFGGVMSREFGGIEYGETALVYAKNGGEGEAQVRLLNACEKQDAAPRDKVYDITADDFKENTDDKEMAYYIAEGIADILAVPDGNDRRVSEGDIAVLYRSETGVVRELYDILKDAGINVFLRRKAYFSAAWEIKALENFIKVLACGLDETALAGYLLSPLCGLGEAELYRAAKSGRGEEFADKLQEYAKTHQDATAEKLTAAFETLSRYGETARDADVMELISGIVAEKHYAEKILASERGATGVETLEKYMDYLASLKNAATVSDYVRYLGSNSGQFESAAPSGSLQIMTVHMSKGLQFPYVFLIDCDKKFNMTDVYSRCTCDKKYGLCIKTGKKDSAGALRSNFMAEAAALRLEKRSKEEESRILYVALTRAEKALYCYSFNNWKSCPPQQAGSFLDWLMPASKECVCVSSPKKTFAEEEIAPAENCPADEQLVGAIIRQMNYVYPHTSAAIKATVTSLAGEESVSAVTVSDGDIQLMEKGERLHKAMEKIDFFSDIDGSANQQVLSALEGDERSKIIAAHGMVGQLLRSFGGKIYREQDFVYNFPDGSLVQGRIDLMAVNGDKALLVDYKLSSAANIEKDRYVRQINLYADAVEDILKKTVSDMYLYSFISGKAKKVERKSVL